MVRASDMNGAQDLDIMEESGKRGDGALIVGGMKKVKPKAPPKPKKKFVRVDALVEETEPSEDQDSVHLFPSSQSVLPVIGSSGRVNNGTSSPGVTTLPRGTPVPVYDIPYMHRPLSTLPAPRSANNYPSSNKNNINNNGSIGNSSLTGNGKALGSRAHESPRNSNSRAASSTPVNAPEQGSGMNAANAVAALNASPGTLKRPAPTGARGAEYHRLHRVGYLRGKAHTDSYKVIAFICGFFAAILLVMGLASSEWLIATNYRQGLFVYCVGEGQSEATVPFVSSPDKATEGCHRIDLNQQAYTLVAAAFCVVSLLVDVFATLLTVLGLRCRDPNKKYKYYRIAVYVMALALVTVLVALVVYPVCFAQIMDGSKRPFWEFGWAYGVGWGASIFLFGGVILLLCDKESEEIYYKERTIVQYADTNNKV
ncbi:unnamed protein product [Allacma fusca]|uniref:Transmembrane protein 47 n=1 Tax=Allacma fusca TaxID=39272 RepID=A0A8J2PJK3_9HEXA|nr:unnamed protein product [Allacma fusca]